MRAIVITGLLALSLVGCRLKMLDKAVKEPQGFAQSQAQKITPFVSPESKAGWQAVMSADIASVSPEWSVPVWIEELSSTGWEDGTYISSDGSAVYFIYINIDLLKLPAIVPSGPNRDEAMACNPPCGQFPRADLFYSLRDSQGRWQKPVPHPLTVAYPVGGLVMSGGKAYFMQEKDDGLRTEICYAEKIDGQWQEPVRIPALSSKHKDDDPYVNPADDEMFFWSNRPAQLGGDNIYYSQKINGSWQEPVILPEPINSNYNDIQPFLFGNALYFTSDRDGKPKIYKSTIAEGAWSRPEVVIESKFGVGEPTLTADGNRLYFIQLFVSDKGETNPEIMFVEKK